MRARVILLVGALLLSVGADDAPPAPNALRGFQPGAWQVTPIGSDSRRSLCLVDPVPMLTAGRAPGGCKFTNHADVSDSATMTWRCASGLSGRTELRRDSAGIYTVTAQGLEQGLPFASRQEWRRTGSC